jgi:hypothetical protein
MDDEEIGDIVDELSKDVLIDLAKQLKIDPEGKTKPILAREIADKDEDFLRSSFETRRRDFLSKPHSTYVAQKKIDGRKFSSKPKDIYEKLNQIHSGYKEADAYKEAYISVALIPNENSIEIVFKFENHERSIEQWNETTHFKQVSRIKIQIDLEGNSLDVISPGSKLAVKKTPIVIGDISDFLFEEREIFRKKEFDHAVYEKAEKEIIIDELKGFPEEEREKKKEEYATRRVVLDRVDIPGINKITFEGNNVDVGLNQIKEMSGGKVNFKEHGKLLEFETNIYRMYRDGKVAVKGAGKWGIDRLKKLKDKVRGTK